MKITLAAVVALIIGLVNPASGYAQSATPSVPTTKILAIGTIIPGADMAAGRAILPAEVRETVDLYLDGKIDQWFSLQERVGVAFILNLTDVKAAREMLEKLPLGLPHIISFLLIPLGPPKPLRMFLVIKKTPP